MYNTFCYSVTVQLLSTVLICLFTPSSHWAVLCLHDYPPPTCPPLACNLCNLLLVCSPLEEGHVFLLCSLQLVSIQMRAFPALTDP